MILSAAIATLLLHQVGPPIWRSVPDDYFSLIDCVGMSGVGIVTEGKVIVCRSDGKTVAMVKIPTGLKPLWYSPTEGVVSAADTIVEHSGASGQRSSLRNRIDVFAQHGYVFVERNGVAILGRGIPMLAIPEYDSLAGVGIDARGDTAAMICTPMRASTLYVYRRHGDDWTKEKFVRCPELENAALLGITNRHNDLRFLGTGVVVFLAGVSGLLDREEWKKADLKCLDWSSTLLERPGRQGTRRSIYLVGTRLSDGLTMPYCRVSLEDAGERGSAGTGSLSVSEDGQYLFMAVHRKIIRIETQELLRKTKL